MRTNKIQIWYRSLIVILGAFALIYFLTPMRYGASSFFLFYTNLSNLCVVVYFAIRVFKTIKAKNNNQCKPCNLKIKYTLMFAITITFLISHFLLNFGMIFYNDTFNFDFFILHYVVPIMTIFDWLLFDKKGTMKWSDPFLWLSFPLVYFVYIMIVCGFFKVQALPTSRYPYPFIDLDTIGIDGMVVNFFVLLFAFILLGFFFVLLDKLLYKYTSKKAPIKKR